MRKARFVLLLLAFTGAGAQEGYDAEQLAEIERQKNFRTGFEEIVSDLNEGSYLRFTSAIDRPMMLDKILGLRLIDQRVKQSFSEDFETRIPTLVEGMFKTKSDTGMRAHLIGFASRGERGRATVRYDLPDFQFNYHEYELRLDENGRVRITDWVDFLRGEPFTQGVGETLIAAAPSKQAVRKLIDLPRASESQVFQLTELLKATRDRRVDRFLEIFGSMNDDLKAQRITVISHAHLMKDTRNRRKLRTALIEMDRHFPNEPLFSLMLLDYYFPARRYEDALGALRRLETRLGVQDSAMQARISAAALVLNRVDVAVANADAAVQMQPDLELGWWSVARATVVAGDHARAVEALTQLEDQFGHSLGPDALQKDPLFQSLLQSAEYRSWTASRHQ